MRLLHTDQPLTDEFTLIAELFRPLTDGMPEARGLADDVAVLGARPGFDLVVSSDALVAGVHFFSDDPPDLIARKALRVNLSDLAAKGAIPYGYQLMIAWPPGIPDAYKRDFVRGLREDQTRFGICLFGGDTVSTPGPMMVAVTIFGHVPQGSCPGRGGAATGDHILISGPVGDAWLGLQCLKGNLPAHNTSWDRDLIRAYHLPEPRLDLGGRVRSLATAAMDISDGLVADASHIGRYSQVCMSLDLDQVPTSKAAHHLIGLGISPIDLISGGDDYQILCCAPPDGAQQLITEGFVKIGLCRAAEPGRAAGVEVLSQGRRLDITRPGWVHGL